MYICDTCILIDYLRGKEQTRNKLLTDSHEGLAMSAITYMELMVGARNKQEIDIIKKSFAEFQIIELSESISTKARILIETYTKSHGLLLPDALIAATALETNLPYIYTEYVRF